MTTHPSPADLAHRPAPAARPAPTQTPPKQQRDRLPLTAAQAIAPGKLTRDERLRPLYTQGLRISRLHPEARLVALTLLGYANFHTGLIHEQWRPTPQELAYATGLTAGQVLVQLEVLTQRGWIYSRVLTQGKNAGTDVLQLCVPAAVLLHVRARKGESDPKS
ncbi:hypothetical protein [Streptomyces sp. NPDC001914]|uniref:hypothetical protein n=1 Tax=Streptomyces sp. NPDC001914 TaxID=3364623 RepID=UPI003685A1AD